MADIEIKLYPGRHHEAVQTFEASYRDIARMDTEAICERVTEAWFDDVSADRNWRLALVDSGGAELTRNWQPWPQDQLDEQHRRFEFQQQVFDLVNAYRRRGSPEMLA